MLIANLTLGFLIGMQHATQADHVAAMASIAAGKRGMRSIVGHGIVWGAGHSASLLVVGGACLMMAKSVPDSTANLLEAVVGIMLIVLGGHLLYGLWRERGHFEGAPVAPGTGRVLADAHPRNVQMPARLPHRHDHPGGFPWRMFVVGLVHGLAGSAALIVLTAATLESPWWGIAYILIFGLGSVVGMALLSCVIAVPLTLTAAAPTRANRVLQIIVGFATPALGLHILIERAPSLLAIWAPPTALDILGLV